MLVDYQGECNMDDDPDRESTDDGWYDAPAVWLKVRAWSQSQTSTISGGGV